MQVLINGRAADGLTPRLAKRLAPGRGPDEAEGTVLSGDEIIANRARMLKVVLGVGGGFAMLIMGVVVVAAAIHESKDLPFVAPVALTVTVALGTLLPFAYRRRMRQAQANLGAQVARMPPAGTKVRADLGGLTIGQRTQPWSAFAVETLEITRVSSSEGADSYSLQALVLAGDGWSVTLDAAGMRNGAAVVARAWRSLRDAAEPPTA